MKGSNVTRFVLLMLPVLVVITVGLFGLLAVGRLSAGLETTTIYRMTDAHDRSSVVQLQQANGGKIYGLSDAHERAQTVYDPSDAAERARAAHNYEIAKAVEKISDLHSRHTPEELRALFRR